MTNILELKRQLLEAQQAVANADDEIDKLLAEREHVHTTLQEGLDKAMRAVDAKLHSKIEPHQSARERWQPRVYQLMADVAEAENNAPYPVGTILRLWLTGTAYQLLTKTETRGIVEAMRPSHPAFRPHIAGEICIMTIDEQGQRTGGFSRTFWGWYPDGVDPNGRGPV